MTAREPTDTAGEPAWHPDLDDARPDPRKMQLAPLRAHPQRLMDFVSSAFRGVGVPEQDAQLCAEILVDADLRGSETHGTPLLYTHYIAPLRDGTINPQPAIVVTQGSATTVSIDGDNGLGMVVGVRAMERCIEMAAEHGSGWAVCHNTTHSASGGFYVRLAARARMVGFHWSTGGSTIAPPGGGGRLVGNNPHSFAAPGGTEPPFVLDMAPSTTTRPKIRMLGWEGHPLPDTWAVDGEGAPITSPQEFFARRGAILPLGGRPQDGAYKGFGLHLVADVVSGVLSGDGGSLVRAKGAHTSAFGALSIDAFPTGVEYDEAMGRLIHSLRTARTGPGSEPVRYPGERSHAERQHRLDHGIPLRNYVVDELAAMADEFGLSMDPIWMDE